MRYLEKDLTYSHCFVHLAVADHCAEDFFASASNLDETSPLWVLKVVDVVRHIVFA